MPVCVSCVSANSLAQVEVGHTEYCTAKCLKRGRTATGRCLCVIVATWVEARADRLAFEHQGYCKSPCLKRSNRSCGFGCKCGPLYWDFRGLLDDNRSTWPKWWSCCVYNPERGGKSSTHPLPVHCSAVQCTQKAQAAGHNLGTQQKGHHRARTAHTHRPDPTTSTSASRTSRRWVA